MAKNTLDDAIAGLKDLAKEVKRYCERLINNAKFDRTAVGTIVKVLDDHSGYVVAAFGKEYTIASNALFQVNDGATSCCFIVWRHRYLSSKRSAPRTKPTLNTVLLSLQCNTRAPKAKS